MRRPCLSLACLLSIALLLFGLSACTSTSANNHTLVVNGAVHVYASETPPAVYPGSDFIEVLGPQDQVKVEQVEYRNGYMAVKVKLKDGRQGWVFPGRASS